MARFLYHLLAKFVDFNCVSFLTSTPVMSLRVLFITYKVTFLVHLFAIACTLTSLWLPNWIDITIPSDNPGGDHDRVIVQHVGLAEKCVGSVCKPFPLHCHPDDIFCAVWHTAAFTMWVTVVLQLASAIAYASPALVKQHSLASRQQYPYQQQPFMSDEEGDGIIEYEECLDEEEEETGYLLQSGWKIIAYFLMGTIIVQGASVATVRTLFFNSPSRFLDTESGSTPPDAVLALGLSWWLALLSCAISVLAVAILIIVGSAFNRNSSRQFQVYLTDNENETEDDEDESRDFYNYIQRSRIENLHRSSISFPTSWHLPGYFLSIFIFFSYIY